MFVYYVGHALCMVHYAIIGLPVLMLINICVCINVCTLMHTQTLQTTHLVFLHAAFWMAV